jgi:hypothetical protein
MGTRFCLKQNQFPQPPSLSTIISFCRRQLAPSLVNLRKKMHFPQGDTVVKRSFFAAVGFAFFWCTLNALGATIPVSINYEPNCPGPVQNLNLGTITATVVDGTGAGGNGTPVGSSRMDATMTINNPAVLNSGIFECMNLHWVQEIYYDDCPVTYMGVAPPVGAYSIIDPPNGGWDYMYNDGAARTQPNLAIPNYGWFIDNKPWYYNDVGERANTTYYQSYSITDVPTDCPANGITRFDTFLVAESHCACPGDPNSLAPGQFLLLAGFAWTIQNGNSYINSLQLIPQQANADDINTALTNGGFAGYTAVVNKTITCCTPEPSSIVVLVVALGLAGGFRKWNVSRRMAV